LKQTEEATYEATGKLVDGKLGKPPVSVLVVYFHKQLTCPSKTETAQPGIKNQGFFYMPGGCPDVFLPSISLTDLC